MKSIAVTALIVLGTLAVAARVQAIRSIVLPGV